MIRAINLSFTEKKLFVAAGIVVGFLVLSSGAGLYQKLGLGMEEQKAALQKVWARSASVLARSADIDARYNDIHSRYPKLFVPSADITRNMAELDTTAKQAGVQVDMIRPVQRGADKPLCYEMSLRGSWPQVVQFLREAEGNERFFAFTTVSIHRQDPSGELLVSAEAERVSFN